MTTIPGENAPTLPRRHSGWFVRRAETLRSQLEALPDDRPGRHTPLAWILDRIIQTYQHWISDGRNLCQRGPERNCSRLGRRAVNHWGGLKGGLAVIFILLVPHDISCLGCCC